MLTGTCCDPAIQGAVSGIQSGDYSGSPILQARLIADYQNRANWTYDPTTNKCTWNAPAGATYTLDSGDPAGIATPASVDAAHYGGGCLAGGITNGPPTPTPITTASAASPVPSYLLLLAVGVAIGWYLHK